MTELENDMYSTRGLLEILYLTLYTLGGTAAAGRAGPVFIKYLSVLGLCPWLKW